MSASIILFKAYVETLELEGYSRLIFCGIDIKMGILFSEKFTVDEWGKSIMQQGGQGFGATVPVFRNRECHLL